MYPAQASEIFIAQDDLVIDRSNDESLLATQTQSLDTSNNIVKRDFSGRLSWFATVVPKIQGQNLYRDEYTLSIVVVSNRDPAMSTASLFPNPDNERVVNVVFNGAGIGGGDVTLTGATAQDVTLRRGEWLMLSANTNVFNGYDSMGNVLYIALPIFRWYRVVAADAPQGSTVDATLHGPDWDANLATQATIVTGAVSVYEKTIRLDQSSLWTY